MVGIVFPRSRRWRPALAVPPALMALLAIAAEARALDLLPFDGPPPQFTMSMAPKLPPGTATMITYDVGRIAAISPMGVILMRLAPDPPVPADVEPAAKGIEIRLVKSEAPDADQTITIDASAPGDPDQIVISLRVLADGPRLEACGFFIVKTVPEHPPKGLADRINDPRSYIAVGDLARLPVRFLNDNTEVAARPNAKLAATCVDSNIRWDAAYGAASLTVHLEAKPFTYKWLQDQRIPPGAGH